MSHARKTGPAFAFRRVVIVCLLMLTALVAVPRPAMADDAQDAKQLVEKARLTFEAFVADKDMGPCLRSLLKRAKRVLIYPQVLRAVTNPHAASLIQAVSAEMGRK